MVRTRRSVVSDVGSKGCSAARASVVGVGGSSQSLESLRTSPTVDRAVGSPGSWAADASTGDESHFRDSRRTMPKVEIRSPGFLCSTRPPLVLREYEMEIACADRTWICELFTMTRMRSTSKMGSSWPAYRTHSINSIATRAADISPLLQGES